MSAGRRLAAIARAVTRRAHYSTGSAMVDVDVSKLKVEHLEKDRMFVINFDNGERAMLQYDQMPGKLDYWHIEVPPSLRGRGIAEFLAKAGMDYVVQKGLKVHLSCPYMRGKFFPAHPEYKHVVVDF